MSNYKAGDMIRLTRNALGMSQETLCENICAPQTLSRIENGKVSVKGETYQMLMERMGRNGAKAYSTIGSDDLEAQDILMQIDTEISRGEFKTAEKYLGMLRTLLKDQDNVINRQITGRRECIIAYRLKKIEAENL